MSLVTIKTGIPDVDGREEVLTEYLCDWPDCPNVAIHVMGVVKDIRAAVVVCAEHHSAMTAARVANKRTG
jgi:hypothetical protein